MSEYKKPLPRPAVESKPFWDGCKKHQLLLPHCPRCGSYWFPPSVTCPECLNLQWEWKPSRGKGKIHSFGVYHRVYQKGFEPEMPYAVALVQLDEGPRLVSNVIGCSPEELRCDAPVEVVFDDVTDDTTLYKFRRLGNLEQD